MPVSYIEVSDPNNDRATNSHVKIYNTMLNL